MPKVTIRDAVETDLSEINRIYNHYVVQSVTTYQEIPDTIEQRTDWFKKHGLNHPVIVAIHETELVGWGSLSPYHPRSAYRLTVEDSVYVDPEHLRQGIGRALLTELIDRARAIGHHAIIAGIDSEQAGSVRLHESMGFTPAGRLEEVGLKFGRWLDVVYLQLLIR